MLVGYLVGFVDGTAAHVWDPDGLHSYAFAPVAVQGFFVGLGCSRPAGHGAATADASERDLAGCRGKDWWTWVVNLYVNRATLTRYQSAWLRPVGLLPISVFGVYVLLSALPLLRARPPVTRLRVR